MRFALTVAYLCAQLSLALAQDFSKVKIQPTELVPNTAWFLKGSGGNMLLLKSDKEVLLVDDQYRPLSERIDSTIQSLTQGIRPQNVLNTHWHFDHTGGNAYFSQYATLIAHTNAKKRLETGQDIKFYNTSIPAANPKDLPKTLIDSVKRMQIGSIEIELWHPKSAHTDGDLIVFIPSLNIVHMGDCFFSAMYPFIDLESGGSPSGLIKTLEYVISRVNSDTQIIPGHGPVANVSQLKEFKNMLQQIGHHVLANKALGKDKIAELAVFDAIDAKWGGSFIVKKHIIGFFYDELVSQINR